MESLDEGKIEEYLRKQGINSMQDMGNHKFVSPFNILYKKLCVLSYDEDSVGSLDQEPNMIILQPIG